jgi:hypothetical protein
MILQVIVKQSVGQIHVAVPNQALRNHQILGFVTVAKRRPNEEPVSQVDAEKIRRIAYPTIRFRPLIAVPTARPVRESIIVKPRGQDRWGDQTVPIEGRRTREIGTSKADEGRHTQRTQLLFLRLDPKPHPAVDFESKQDPRSSRNPPQPRPVQPESKNCCDRFQATGPIGD